MEAKTIRRAIGAATACAALGVALLALPACQFESSKSLTFKVTTGDDVKVTLDTSDGYDLGSDGSTFTVSKDGEAILQSSWEVPETAEEYMDSLDSEGVYTEPIEVGDHTGIIWSAEGSAGAERDALIDLGGDTYVVIASLDPAMEDALERLTFEVE